MSTRLDGESLTLQVANGARAGLSYRDHGAFHGTWADPVFREYFFGTVATFHVDGEGRIARLSLPLNRDHIEVTRRP